MSLPVPDVFLSIVDVGDTEGAYQCPGVDEDGGLVLESGEVVLAAYSGEFRGPLGILSETTRIIVTSYRFAWIDPRFEAGASWARPGSTPPRPSSGRARDGAQQVAAGHVRHEWVVAIRLRKLREAAGAVDSYVDLVAMTSQGDRTLTGYFPGADDADSVAVAAAKATSERWLSVGAHLLSADDVARLRAYSAGGPGEPVGPDTVEWRMPSHDAAAALSADLASGYE